jgi:hypothetical protein
MNTSVYRIKGVDNPCVVRPHLDLEAEASAVATSPRNMEPELPDPLGRLNQALGTPRLSDVLYHFDETDQLAALWPTFTYFHPRRKFGPIKLAPLRLTQCLFPPPLDENDPLAVSIFDPARRQSREKVAIRRLLTGQEDKMPPDDCPIALAVTSFLRRGSAWFKKHHERILPHISVSSEAAFIALASGAWNDHALDLLEKVAVSPELTVQLKRSPVLKQFVTEDWIRRVLQDHPLHLTVALSFQRKHDFEASQLLYDTATQVSQAAGICLALFPFNPEATARWNLARKDGQALYWAGRVWKASGKKITDLPRYNEIISQLKTDERWAYHWARDIDRAVAEDFARLLWPSPWAVELIEDLSLPKDLATDLATGPCGPKSRFWDNFLTLWAAEYATK